MDYSNLINNAHFPDLVAQVRNTLTGLSAETKQALDENENQIVERIEALLDHVLTVTGSANALLVPVQAIQNLVPALQQVENVLRAASGYTPSTINMTIVQDTSGAVDALAAQLFSWARTEGDDWREAVTAAASTYRRSLGQQVATLASEIEGLEHRRAELRSEFDEASAARLEVLQSDVRAFEEQLAALRITATQVATQADAAKTQVDRSVDRSDQVLASLQQQFSEAQEARSKEAASARDKLLDDSKKLLDAREASATKMLASIQEQVDKASTLVSVFAAAGTANAYSKEAKEQGEKADVWRVAAVVLGVLAGAAAATVLWGASNGDAAWQLLIGKLAIGVTLGGIAAYAASQSARHRRREESARHLELNLATFGSLVGELDEVAIQTARAELVAAMLRSDPLLDAEPKNLGALGEPQLALLRQIADLLNK